METEEKRGVLLVITGPTCAGKDTVMKELLRREKNLVRLVTTNSRPKRPGEKEGVDYYFVNRKDFERKIAEAEFLEWVDYLGHYKGTEKKNLFRALSSGRDVVWRIDVRGVKNIKAKILEMVGDPSSPLSGAIFVFLVPPDLDTLKRRMEKRATEGEKVQMASLDLARWELRQVEDSDYSVLNEDGKIEKTVDDVLEILGRTRKKIEE